MTQNAKLMFAHLLNALQHILYTVLKCSQCYIATMQFYDVNHSNSHPVEL
jgi:hypothetical protein